MTTKGLILALLSGIALIGCTPSGLRPFSGVSKDCDTANCPDIIVTVEGTPRQVKVSIDTLVMKHGNNDANIMWKLGTSGYKFQRDSVQFKDPQRADTQFTFVNQNDNMFHMRDKNKDDVNAYAYQIKVYDTNTGVWLPLDPWVVNN